MPLIKEQLDTFQELAPFVKMTVAPNGVTVGDLAFVSAQTHWSTVVTPTTAPDTVNGDLSLDLFQAAIGDTGQGWSTALTRAQSSWVDSQGRLPANQAFIAVEAAFQVFNRTTNSCVDPAAVESLIKNVSALEAIGQNLTWDLTVGDGITRTVGTLGSYGGLGGVFGVPPSLGNAGAFDIADRPGAQGVSLGDPCIAGVRLRVPLVFPPNINVRIRVRNGNAFEVEGFNGGQGTLPGPVEGAIANYLAIRLYLRGYLCTMPV